jgi:hypothetical protein
MAHRLISFVSSSYRTVAVCIFYRDFLYGKNQLIANLIKVIEIRFQSRMLKLTIIKAIFIYRYKLVDFKRFIYDKEILSYIDD